MEVRTNPLLPEPRFTRALVQQLSHLPVPEGFMPRDQVSLSTSSPTPASVLVAAEQRVGPLPGPTLLAVIGAVARDVLTVDAEREIGRHIPPDKARPLVTKGPLPGRLESLGRPLAQAAGIPCDFYVVDARGVGAGCGIGHRILVNRGLLELTENVRGDWWGGRLARWVVGGKAPFEPDVMQRLVEFDKQHPGALEAAQEWILAHELGHAARRDPVQSAAAAYVYQQVEQQLMTGRLDDPIVQRLPNLFQRLKSTILGPTVHPAEFAADRFAANLLLEQGRSKSDVINAMQVLQIIAGSTGDPHHPSLPARIEHVSEFLAGR